MIRNTIHMTALGLGVLLLAVHLPAMADGERFNIDNELYRDACGACHVAYPPQLLPGR